MVVVAVVDDGFVIETVVTTGEIVVEEIIVGFEGDASVVVLLVVLSMVVVLFVIIGVVVDCVVNDVCPFPVIDISAQFINSS